MAVVPLRDKNEPIRPQDDDEAAVQPDGAQRALRSERAVSFTDGYARVATQEEQVGCVCDGNAAEDVATGVGNVAGRTADAIGNEVGDVDVDVDVTRNESGNRQ